MAAWSAAGALAGGNWWRAARWQACRAAAGARRRLPRCAAGPELAHALARRPNLNYLPNLPACNLHARLTSHSSHALSGRVHRPRRQGHDRRPRQAGGRLAAAPTPAATPSERRPAKTRRVERSPDIPVPMADPDTRQSMMPKAVGRAPRPTALFVVRDTTNAIIVTLAKPLATHLVMMVADVKKSQRCSACGANGRERKRSYAFPNHPQRGVWGCPVCALGTTSHALWKALVPLIAGTTNSVVIRDPQSAL